MLNPAPPDWLEAARRWAYSTMPSKSKRNAKPCQGQTLYFAVVGKAVQPQRDRWVACGGRGEGGGEAPRTVFFSGRAGGGWWL
jgi:hypothetical protein